MAELVDGLAALAESRSEPLDRAVVDIGQLTTDVRERARSIPEHPWTSGGVAEGTALADRRRLVQAWLQLADNAAKYSPAGAPIEIGSRAVPDGFELWVRDHGPGIAEADRARIFERFTRVAGSSVRGSGLGLAIVDGIARAHGGSVRHDALEDGSRFVLTIPQGVSV